MSGWAEAEAIVQLVIIGNIGTGPAGGVGGVRFEMQKGERRCWLAD